MAENERKEDSAHQAPPREDKQPPPKTSPPQVVEEPPTPTPMPIPLQPPPPPRARAQPLQVPQGSSPHHRLAQRRASDVIDSGGASPSGSPGSGLLQGSLPRDFVPYPLPSPRSPRSPASDRGYGGSAFSSPVTPVRDTTDAAPANLDPQPHSHGTVPTAIMAVERDAEEYNMRHKRRGRAVIINNDEFQMVGMTARAGSDVDVKNLSESFKALEFEVQIHTNKQFREINEIIHQLAAEDHTDADCIAVAVLTHGLGNNYLLAQDVPYPVHMLWQPFTADNCLTLAGKPKLFFIQACRGDKLDAGVSLRRRSRTQTDSGTDSYKIPTHSDFLLAFSAPEGFYSWRNPENGTWFIQCLSQELKANAQSMDILRLLTRVSRRVALDYESFNDLVPWENQCKQVPSFTSMLIRDLIFHPKV
ncbi:hypothetical protein R5R35_003189 [Gryllus longicercus]|uniref:Caspase-1 n=1 Tax=Gryllus longicercus TaxID=2509291 RepID=A0AAN9Z1K9_9ORTH